MSKLLSPSERVVVLMFDALRRYVEKKMPELKRKVEPMLLWFGCPYAEDDHQRKDRVYAHTNHVDGVICVCESLGKLSGSKIFGILAHEFGHIAAMAIKQDGSEAGADRAAREYLELPIQYTRDSKAIQYLGEEEISKVSEYAGGEKPSTRSILSSLGYEANELLAQVDGILGSVIEILCEKRREGELKLTSMEVCDASRSAMDRLIEEDVVFLRSATHGEAHHFFLVVDGEQAVCVDVPEKDIKHLTLMMGKKSLTAIAPFFKIRPINAALAERISRLNGETP